MADFIPRSDDEVVAWCANFVGKLGTHGATVGLSTTEVTDLKKHCEDAVAALQQSGKKRAEYQSAVAAAEAAKVTHLGPVRAQLRRMKTHPAWTEVIGRDLQALSSTSNTVAMDELVPDLEAGGGDLTGDSAVLGVSTIDVASPDLEQDVKDQYEITAEAGASATEAARPSIVHSRMAATVSGRALPRTVTRPSCAALKAARSR